VAKNSEAATPAHWLETSDPAPVVGFLLRSLHLSLRHAMDEALRQQGVELSFAHFAALFSLHFEPGMTGAQLARRALVSAQTMNSALRRLEKERLVERRPHPESRRADSWQLTHAGLRELARARTIGDEVFSRMLSGLTESDVARLQTYLCRCIVALGAEDSFIERIVAEHAARIERRQRRSA
jgi:DNA-binding MarR family transcriptional regulator